MALTRNFKHTVIERVERDPAFAEALLEILPDALAQRARSEGFLTDDAIQRLLEEAMRRQAGRRLMQVAERLHAANIEPMSEEALDAEIQASRAERRAGQGERPQPQHSTK